MRLRLARLLLSAIFVGGGARALAEPAPRVSKAAAMGVPQPLLAVRLNAMGMVVAGGALAMGLRSRAAAWLLAALLVPTTVAGHPFWRLSGPDREAQQTHVLKNLGLLGGLLAVIEAEQRGVRR